ncbi:MAG: winged helix-turn-helix domain-containing protein, partial [Myxococcota bacterium]
MKLTACSVDLVRRQVTRDRRVTALTSREADLLAYFGRNPSREIPRGELLDEVWGYARAAMSRATDNTVRRLREKVERDASRPDHILTVHGIGYRFEPVGAAEVEEVAPSRTWVAFGAVRVDLPQRRAVVDDRELALTEGEARLLPALLAANGGVVSREALTRAVWG